ncbi:EamA family transporter [Pokkaliibacter sp. CJK22405]|uniref:EamA family transporter n=1 Tax=Pokkaliibacter sp. CJK22405 TaxID=3384615 RepID=UPI0039853A61
MKFRDLALGISVMALWGINFSFIKLGLKSLDPFVLAGLRFSLSALPLVFFIKRPAIHMGWMALYGVLFGVGLWGMAFLGIHFGLSAGLAALVMQFHVFVTIFMAAVLLNEKLSRFNLISMAFALLGLLLVMGVTDGSMTVAGFLLVILATVSRAGTNILVKKIRVQAQFSFVVWTSLFAPIPLFALAWLTQGPEVFVATWQAFDRDAVISLLVQVYPTTLIGYWIWNSLMVKYPAATVAPLTLLVPIFGFLGSYLMFGETIDAHKTLAVVLILLAVVINMFGPRWQQARLKRRELSLSTPS